MVVIPFKLCGFFYTVLNHEDYISVKVHSKKRSRRADVRRVLGKADNKLNSRFPNSGFTQISHVSGFVLVFSRIARNFQCIKEGETQKDS